MFLALRITVEAVDDEQFFVVVSELHVTAVALDFTMFLYTIHYVKCSCMTHKSSLTTKDLIDVN